MAQKIIDIGNGFWNIRGSFKIGGVVDIGTHASLVQRANGNFVMLDSLTLRASARRRIMEMTGDGAKVDAILNLHPFHTVHVQRMHKLFPGAALYGTSRHIEKAPDLPWKKTTTDDPKLHKKFADVLDFSVPEGVDFISDNENVHFSSVLAYHRASKTIHSDDTLMCLKPPLPARVILPSRIVSFHPTLRQALEKRAGATADFKNWAESIIDDWMDAVNLCAAHNDVLLRVDDLPARMHKALRKTRHALQSHQSRHK